MLESNDLKIGQALVNFSRNKNSLKSGPLNQGKILKLTACSGKGGRVTGYGLRVTGYGLRVAGYGVRGAENRKRYGIKSARRTADDYNVFTLSRMP